MTKRLFFYRCRICTTFAASTSHEGKYVRCNGCPGFKMFWCGEAVDTPEREAIWAYAKEHGIAHLPLPEPPKPWVCVRCGVEFPKDTAARLRVDGRCCKACFDAEEHPEPLEPPRQLTDEEHAAILANKAREEKADQDRMEAAYAELEGEL